jgi:hypothetical protein
LDDAGNPLNGPGGRDRGTTEFHDDHCSAPSTSALLDVSGHSEVTHLVKSLSSVYGYFMRVRNGNFDAVPVGNDEHARHEQFVTR